MGDERAQKDAHSQSRLGFAVSQRFDQPRFKRGNPAARLTQNGAAAFGQNKTPRPGIAGDRGPRDEAIALQRAGEFRGEDRRDVQRPGKVALDEGRGGRRCMRLARTRKRRLTALTEKIERRELGVGQAEIGERAIGQVAPAKRERPDESAEAGTVPPIMSMGTISMDIKDSQSLPKG